MASMKLFVHILRRYISIAITLFYSLIWCLFDNFDYPILIKLADTFLSLYFLIFCDLRPITVDLNDGETTLHFWISGHRKINRPNLLMLHGYGGNSKWQFIHQVSDLSKSFNLFIPDLVFFGKSYSKNTDRSVEFQARSIVGGLKRLGCGVGDLSVYSISYGGFVAYRIAKIWPEMIEKLVIVSSGVGFTQQQKMTEMKKHGGDVSEILVPSNPRDLRLLVKVSMNTGIRFIDWVPDFILSQFIAVMYETNRQELVDLAKNLLEREEEPEFFAISQKTLIVWGDKDNVFPLEHGRRLQRHLPNSSLEVLKEIGHGVNIEAPTTLNNLIISFVLEKDTSHESCMTACQTTSEDLNQLPYIGSSWGWVVHMNKEEDSTIRLTNMFHPNKGDIYLPPLHPPLNSQSCGRHLVNLSQSLFSFARKVFVSKQASTAASDPNSIYFIDHHRAYRYPQNKINQDLSLMESRMEGDVYSGFGERYQMDGKLLQNFQKSFVQVQDILDQNRLLINEINQNHESKQADHLGRNVGLIRELNNNIRTVASLYGDLSHSFARSIDASSEGESTGTLKSDGKANNQKRFRSG
ncbi:unnamed protein product [Arabidopsis arenosa]|nr:unnamed protein product [Arabidopsis arenosa]